MNITEIQARVKRSFGDESGVQIDDTDIFRWINDAQREIVKNNNGLLEKTALSTITKDVQDYPVPVDALLIQSMSIQWNGESGYTKIRGASFNQFNEFMDNWDGGTGRGQPVTFTIYAGKILLFPIPDVTVLSAMKLFYTRKPVDVVLVGDAIDLPVEYHEAIVKYCLQQAFEMDEDWDAVGIKASEFSADLTLLKDRSDWKEQSVYPTMTIREEDQF